MNHARAKAGFFVAACFLMSVLIGVLLAAPVGAATRREAGIATSGSLVGMDREILKRRLDDIKALGAVWIRVDFNWATIQPRSRDHFDWSGYDYLVEQASWRGLKILAVLAYTPAWAQEPSCKDLVDNQSASKKCAPRNVDDFANFARVTAERYRHQRIRGYEIWNEPNLLSYWRSVREGQLVVAPQEFARMANAAAVAIRTFNRDCVLLPGGLAPLFEPTPERGLNQGDFTAQLLPHLRKDLFTGIAIHPYSWPVLPGTQAEYNAFYTVDNGKPNQNLRQVMKSVGWGDKEIWATEFGASTRGNRVAGATRTRDRPDHVTEDAQAQIVSQGIDRWYKKENVGPLFVHSDSDTWLRNRKNEGGFGLRRSDGTQKPAYDAYKKAVRSIPRR